MFKRVQRYSTRGGKTGKLFIKKSKKLLQSSKEIKRGKLKEHVLYELGVASNKEDGKYIKSKKYLIIRKLE